MDVQKKEYKSVLKEAVMHHRIVIKTQGANQKMRTRKCELQNANYKMGPQGAYVLRWALRRS